jgi:uncharacterized protein YwqG
MTKAEFVKQISRAATLFEAGGFRPTDDIKASWIGKVTVGKAGEEWPTHRGTPLHPLCQINITQLPFVPDNLKELKFITVFFSEDHFEGYENDNNVVCVRTYTSLDELMSLTQPQMSKGIKPFQLRAALVEKDFPCFEDCPVDVPSKYEDDFSELFLNVPGIKIGGWPTLIQSEISWPNKKATDDWEYAFQIDSTPKANLQWGDGGVAYFGRSCSTGEWNFAWQCM